MKYWDARWLSQAVRQLPMVLCRGTKSRQSGVRFSAGSYVSQQLAPLLHLARSEGSRIQFAACQDSNRAVLGYRRQFHLSIAIPDEITERYGRDRKRQVNWFQLSGFRIIRRTIKAGLLRLSVQNKKSPIANNRNVD